MNTDKAVNIADLKRMAKRHMPRVVFDFVEGGLEDEHGLQHNEDAFKRHRLLPRYLVDTGKRELATTLFGRSYALPFGIAPTGLAALCRPGADLMLAEAAAAANVPFIMSGASTASIEAAARVAPQHCWYQLYAARDPKISEDLIRRTRDAGLAALVLTVDVPVNSKRERNIRNGFVRPYKLKPAVLLEALRHPSWIADYLRHGKPVFANWAPYAPPGAGSDEVADFLQSQTPSVQTWRDLETYRRLWPRTLIVKGILHPDDARRAADLGVDGIMVSNHGGRQLDRAPSPLEMLLPIKQAVGARLTVMFDSGIRRGSDIVIARCLGAQFIFLGRATLYGAAAGGVAGAKRAIDILRDEVDRALIQLGCPNFNELGPNWLVNES
ncbi:MAG TPA: alpha-hydroxy acid oxidase [Stellaceae bacterium]|nr:alpha-hydroxy acid oxidase [Stellaceae bacterium]